MQCNAGVRKTAQLHFRIHLAVDQRVRDTDMATVDAALAPSVNFMTTDPSRFISQGGTLPP
jgi:hypothetical protein